MFVTGPDVVRTVTNEEVTAEALGGARAHTRTSGVAHLAVPNDITAMAAVRDLVSYLPSSNLSRPPTLPTEDPIDRADAALDAIVPADPNVPYDMGVTPGALKLGEAPHPRTSPRGLAGPMPRPLATCQPPSPPLVGVCVGRPSSAGCLTSRPSMRCSRITPRIS